jgi:hypothetical protein
MSAKELYAKLGSSRDVLAAMIYAEKYGRQYVYGVLIMCTGYADGCTEFSAGTALYTVRY